jgi:hypothetical protein
LQDVQDLCCLLPQRGFVTGQKVEGAVAEAADLQEAGGRRFSHIGYIGRFGRAGVLRVARLASKTFEPWCGIELIKPLRDRDGSTPWPEVIRCLSVPPDIEEALLNQLGQN